MKQMASTATAKETQGPVKVTEKLIRQLWRLRRFLAFGVLLNMVAVPLAARAGNETVSDKADWIKKNLTALGAPSKAEPEKISIPKEVSSRKCSIHMRAFVPNRYLPRKSDLESEQAHFDYSQALETQKPSYDISGESTQLTGNVSAYAGRMAPPTNNSYSRYQVQMERKLDRAFRSPTAMQRHEQPRIQARPIEPQAFAQSAAPEAMPSVQPELSAVSPITSKDEKAIDALSNFMAKDQSQDQASQADNQSQAATTDTAGPAPFPLNLIPKKAITDILAQGRVHRVKGPAAYFGSWHGQPQKASLPATGFHSYLTAMKLPGCYFSHIAASHMTAWKGKALLARSAREPRFTDRSGFKNYRNPTILTYPAYDNASRTEMF